MKRFLLLILLGSAGNFVAGSSAILRAQDQPHRFVELGIDADVSFANSYLTSQDLLKETVTLDLTELTNDLTDGLKVFVGAHAGAFLNVNLWVTWGFGLFANVDAMGQFKVPQSLMELITTGNSLDKTYSDSFGIGAASFLEAGFWVSSTVERVAFVVRPAYFLPLAYLNNSRVKYSFLTKADGTISATGSYDIDIYTPLSLEEMLSFNLGDMLSKGGVDFTLRAEYPLLHNLTVGSTLSNIPFLPAQLDYRYKMTSSLSFQSDLEGIINNFEDGLDYQLPEFQDGNTEKAILRPFKIGFDAVYRPFHRRIFSLKPDFGLVFNSIFDVPVYVDFGLTAEFSLFNILILDAGTHYEDMIWKQRLGLTLNFRALELDVALILQSQEFVKSFNGAGYSVNLGARLGF